MELCNECDIVFNEKKCPLCQAKHEINTLEDEIVSLNDKLNNMEG